MPPSSPTSPPTTSTCGAPRRRTAQAFDDFAATLDPDGFLVCCVDDPGARALAALVRARGGRVVTVGEAVDADVRATRVAFAGSTSSFAVTRAGADLGTVRLRIPGRHYVLDALAALVMGLELGHDLEGLRAGLESFIGSGRRMEAKGEAGGVRVYDSYAHHPREIEADLEAARAVAGDGRLVVVFQPHLVSRTRIFGPADGAGAGRRRRGRRARRLPRPRAAGRRPSPAPWSPTPCPCHPVGSTAPPGSPRRRRWRPTLARPGDLVLTLGAGDVTTVGPRVLTRLGVAAGA